MLAANQSVFSGHRLRDRLAELHQSIVDSVSVLHPEEYQLLADLGTSGRAMLLTDYRLFNGYCQCLFELLRKPRACLPFEGRQFVQSLLRGVLVGRVDPKETEAMKTCFLLGIPLQRLRLRELSLLFTNLVSRLRQYWKVRDVALTGMCLVALVPFIDCELEPVRGGLRKLFDEFIFEEIDFDYIPDKLLLAVITKQRGHLYDQLSLQTRRKLWRECLDIFEYEVVSASQNVVRESGVIEAASKDLVLFRHLCSLASRHPMLTGFVHSLADRATTFGCLNNFYNYASYSAIAKTLKRLD